jgi:molybdate transport system ATP-binding protein
VIRFALTKRLHAATGPMLFRVDEEIADGEFVALTGPSGAGKTTLLRMLAGLSAPDEGTITAAGERWYDGEAGVSVPTRRRGLGFVFQDAALFPHMTVRENLAFAAPKGDAGAAAVEELLAMAELGALSGRRPATLSGGQQQRVALARALVRRPKLLLLDEPLSALDREARVKLQDELLAFHGRFRMTVLMVTHDLPEIFRLAGKVIALEAGKVARRGTPQELFAGAGMSGKFKFVGEVVAMEPADVVVLVSVLVGSDVVRVVATREEAAAFAPGDRVVVASKAFNPLIRKV